MRNEAPFWIVWNPTGRNPQYRHSTADDATAEAERLAKLHAGESFYVLQSWCKLALQKTNLVPLTDDIPF